MPLTDNNLNKEAFGETRTFAVAEHSADTMKARINRDNSQALRAKKQSALPPKQIARHTEIPSRAAPHGRVQTPAPRQIPEKTTPVTEDMDFDFLPPEGAAESANSGSGRSYTEFKPGDLQKNTQPAPVTESPSPIPSNAPARDAEPDRTPAAVPAPAPIAAESAPARPAVNPAPEGPEPADRQIAPPRAERSLDALSGRLSGRLSAELSAEAAQSPQKPVPAKAAPGKSAAVQPAKSANPIHPVRAGEDRLERQMMKTRTSDFKIDADRATAGRRKKQEPEVREVSDEGGNTVLSVIKAIVYIIFVLISAIALSVFSISVANDIYAFVKPEDAVEVTIPENTTLDELSKILAEKEVIRYPTIFKFYAVHQHDDMEYVPGTYTVTPMMNYDALLSEFKEKEVTGTVRITIPEGYTTDDIISLFVDKYGIGTREGFVDVIQNYDFDYWFIRELEETGVSENRIYRLDGYLFPDTYEFYLNSSEQTVINRLLVRFGQIYTRDYRSATQELGFTVDQVVTLASMIEKEAAAPSEFFNVASVFLNRLKIPDVFPRLESDATVVYAIQHDTGERTVDLYYDSPYNTYMYDGFPPGPIANPSASAILSVLLAQETNYYYFVSGEGMTYFSETKEEHDQHIAEIVAAGQAQNMAEPYVPQTPAEGQP